MNCPKCNYHRTLSFRCAKCFEPVEMQGAFEEYMQDYLNETNIKTTKLYIFPTALGSDKSFAHWLCEGLDSEKNWFFRYEGASNSMIGFSVDAIVNSANNYLIPGSGLAKYLRQKLSLEYDRCCDELSKGNLTFGEAYFIPIPSQFRIKKGIIEAISIKYEKINGRLHHIPSAGKDIYNCIYNSLKIADENKLQTIAIPQMASREGYSIYPKNAGKAMLSATILAIKDYLHSNKSNLTQIFLHPTTLEDEEYLLNII